MRIASCLLPITVAASALPAQTVQYRSPAGVEYRSVADTSVVLAEAALDADPRSIDKILALGAAQSAARQFREAIDTYTRGLAIAPNHAMLYRWRGHRHLSVRELDRARADLHRSLRLDSASYGALYHLGIVYFAGGDFSEAARYFARAQRDPPNAGELAGATDWLWMSLMRAGRSEEARAMLARRPDSLPVDNAYATRLRLYRGEITPEDVLTPADTADVQVATLAYGVGNWYVVRGDTTRARRWFERSIQSGGWPAFGFIVSEMELRRLDFVTSQPTDAWLEAYLEGIGSQLEPVRRAHDSLAIALRADSGTSRADSTYWLFRTLLSSLVDSAERRFGNDTFAVLVAPHGSAASQRRRQLGALRVHVGPRDEQMAARVRGHLAARGVRVRMSEGDVYLFADDSTLFMRHQRFLTVAGREAARFHVIEQRAPVADDGSIPIPMDSLGERLARAESFGPRHPTHVAAADVAQLHKAYLRFFITGNDNTAWFDHRSRALRPEALQTYRRFLARHPNAAASREVRMLLSLLAKPTFRMTPAAEAYMRTFWRHE